MEETSSSRTVSPKLERIAKLAKDAPQMAFTTLAHHIDIDWLREAYRRTRKDGAAGVDGQTADEYAAKLEENLQSLLDRVKSGTYRAPPVRRVDIPKGDGSQTRPIGIPTFEDKVLQRAVVMLLEAVYEQDFRSCSYGFRPGRSAHQALDALRSELMRMGGGWVLEVDIQKFFDTLDHDHLRNILHQRVRDGVILRLIGKWLNAGVQQAGQLSYPEQGTPQGGVVSPLLANIYLHEVLDVWFARDVVPRLRGKATLIRYADDFVLLFETEDDARRVWDVLSKRFEKYGLMLHPEKTRLVEFCRPAPKPPAEKRNGGGGRSDLLDRSAPKPPAEERNGGGGRFGVLDRSAPKSPAEERNGDVGTKRPGTFDLLGFTYFWARSRKGWWVVKQKTAKGRFSRALKRVAEWCRLNRHRPVREQWQALVRKLRGHFGYYGIIGNSEAIARFRYEVIGIWRRWLHRRSQRARMIWARIYALLKRYPLPAARVRALPSSA
jgi:group II intron reverse transcriptase/maturase